MRIQSLYDFPCKIKNNRLSSLIYKVNKGIINVFYPYTVKLNYGLDESSDVIVSLTSYPGRIDIVWITVATLLNQTVKPKMVVLWLAADQFPDKEKDLPEKLLNLRKQGLTIRFCDNLYPHKKYYYTMLEYPEATVITVDDDMFYPEYLVEELTKTSGKFPGTVCCTRAHEISLDENGYIKPYEEWNSCLADGTQPSKLLMPVGCGGVLYPPHSLFKDVFDKEKIERFCLKADDLWLKSMAVLNYTPAVRISRPSKTYFTILKTRKNGLYFENVMLKRNDLAMKNIVGEYPDIERILKD